MLRFLPAVLVLSVSFSQLYAETFQSVQTGDWNGTSLGTWSPAGNPQTGTNDSVSVLTGHTVTWTGSSVGLPNSGDLGTANGQSINLNGGISDADADGLLGADRARELGDDEHQ